MDDLKKLYEEVCETLEKVNNEQREVIKKSKDYLNDTQVAYNYGQITALLPVWSKLREMIGE